MHLNLENLRIPKIGKKSGNRDLNISWLFIFLFPFLLSCSREGGVGQLLSKMIGFSGTSSFNTTSFPSPGSAPSPEGSDLYSISTNYSAAIDDPESKANPLSGAIFISPPEPNNFGAVSLNYPIEITPGRAGIQPNVSLGYSSSGGDGWLGVGWNLGMGSIIRTPEYGALYYDVRDSFSWNGKKLIKVSGDSSNENGTYRPEVVGEDFTILRLTNIENGGIWEVRDSSGQKSIYGQTSSSRIYDPNKITRTYSWNLSQVEDTNGNFMDIEYDTSEYSENRVLYLKEIRYTGNSRSGVSAKQYVRFITKTRDDSYVSKVPGYVMKMNKLLDKIQVGYNGSKLWEYRMIYEISTDSGRPKLVSVDSDRNTTKPSFEYQTASRILLWQNVTNAFSSEPEDVPGDSQLFEGDFNGDGISDIVFFNSKTGNWKAAEGKPGGGYTFKTYANRYKGYDNLEKIRFFKGNVSGDYNGDGRADIAFYLPQTRDFIVAEHNGNNFQFKNYGRLMTGIPDIFRMEWFPGDYDGNGLSDAVLFDEPTGSWTLMLNKGGQFEFLKFSSKFKNLYRGDYNPDGNMDSQSTTDISTQGKGRINANFLVGDYNGDGRTDISLYDARSGKWIVGENNRNPDTSSPLYFKFDWYIYKVFTAPEQRLFTQDRFSGDFDGDGFSDFLVFDRSSGDWILGQTGDRTINFRVWSRAPQFKEITKWLQGDFNGDGSTDIGFYSASDGKFWIGEATGTGFRYRVYSDMNYGPSAERVMKSPLPLDEVTIAKASAVVQAASDTKTILLDYAYDGSDFPNRGELAFPGCFTVNDCSTSPELLIYNRKTTKFDIRIGAATTIGVFSDFNPELSGLRIANNGKTDRFTRNTKDEVLFYQESGTGNTFSALRNASSASFEKVNFASFTDSEVGNFYYDDTTYIIDNFSSASVKSVLIFDDQPIAGAGTGKFLLSGPTGNRNLIPMGALTQTNLTNFFRLGTSGQNRSRRKDFSLFSGNFLGASDGTSQLLIVDRSTSTHTWYIGVVDALNSKITFTKLGVTGTPNLPLTAVEFDSKIPAGIPYGLYPESIGKSIMLGKSIGDNSTFYKFKISGGNVSSASYSAISAVFGGEFDNSGNPLVVQFDLKKIFDITKVASVPLPESDLIKQVDRSDLFSKIYPFEWIQGDYNGDGITDIGIIHLREPTWYYAMSTGSVPDIINRIKNGIGGIYDLEYDNSTKFDNTGGDGIPDLPASYRVCTKIIADDGFGNRVQKSYQYSSGVAFSAFINGKKETDYFGFTNFSMKDSLGASTVHTFHSMPYSDFMMNRALGGAEKEMHILGSDNQDYGKSLTSYDVKKMEVSPGVATYVAYSTKKESYLSGARTTTSTNLLTIDSYSITKKVESVTDHYEDASHSSETIVNSFEFETDTNTNERRIKKSVSFQGSNTEKTSLMTYDGQGNLTKTVTSYTGSGLPATKTSIIEYAYDTLGNKVLEKDSSSAPARGKEFVYDDDLRQFVKESTAFGGGIRFKTTYVIDYSNAFGNPTRVTDPNGNKTEYEYDLYGRITETSADTDSGTKTLASYNYSSNFPLSALTNLGTGTGDPDFSLRKYSDGLGRAIYQVKTASNGKFVRTGRIVYDSVGRVARIGQPDWADGSELDSFALHMEEKNPTYFEYDAIGRQIKTILPQAAGETSASVATTTYNGAFEVLVETSGGTRKRTIQNARGKSLFVEDSGTDGTSAQIGFCYDLSGNLIKKSDLNGTNLSCGDITTGINQKDLSGKNQTYWQYDAFGQLVTQSDPDLGITKNVYNAFGDLTKTTDARGYIIQITYDSFGRMILKELQDGDVHYTYDSGYGSENALGKLVSVDSSSQLKTFSYDKLGRPKKETRLIKDIPLQDAGGPYETNYTYDLLGRVTTIHYPEHPVSHTRMKACYTYGSAGYITGISVQVNTNGILPGFCGKTIVENIAYNEFGQTAGFALGNGVQTDYTYDVKRRLVRIHSSGDVDGTTKVLQDAVYAFNENNNIVGISNTSSEYNTNYTYDYDGLNRLVNASGIYTESADNYTKNFRQSFDYAQNGNLLKKRRHDFAGGQVLDEWAYQYQNHQVLKIDSTQTGLSTLQMGYDAVGNMTTQTDNSKDLKKEIHFDSENRISFVEDKDGAEVGKYRYDEGGFRVRKTALVPKGAEIKHQEILYPSKFYGLEYVEEDNTLQSINNIYLNGVRIAALNEDGVTAYFLTDQVDSVGQILDDNAHTVSLLQYEPYGATFVQRGNQNFSPKYNSQELDQETSFYFYNARYYDPEIARFASADTVIDGAGSTQGWNRFSYVAGNPIRYKDPTGHEGFSPGQWSYFQNGFRGLRKEIFVPTVRKMEREDKGEYKWFAGPGMLAPYAIYASADLLEHDYSKFAKRTATDVPLAITSWALLGAGPAYTTTTAGTNAIFTNGGRLILTSPGTKGFLKHSIPNLLKAFGSAPPDVKKQITNKVAERLIYGNVGRELTNLVTGVGFTKGVYDFFVDGPFSPNPPETPWSAAGLGAGETVKDMWNKYDEWKENSKKSVKQDAPKSKNKIK
ncbi:SpvB/TcaC N-terminal domain-containing protein [Leptospira johnsonii]|nr:SpvB/TcaC N-terminal domain-containing protein [Leptospira johnsonii]